ncbi:MAG: polysaccharide deacetylase family protein [Candidatus Bathyarchaeia archaeon]|jgi:predicted nucleotidyltransferase
MPKKRPQVFLTFDVEGPAPHEDVLDQRTQFIIMVILRKLRRNRLRGLFFLPGSVACAVQKHPELLEALQSHEIGYHSSTHSTRPLIFEFTDIPDYNAAIAVSIEKETQLSRSSVAKNVQGKGLLAFQEMLPEWNIVSFRAPFMCWSPPHLEALQSLGISYDFSSSVTDRPFYYRGVMFYPPPMPLDGIPNMVGFWGESASNPHKGAFKLNLTLSRILRGSCTVLSLHPARLVFKTRRNYLKKDSKNIERGSLDVAIRLCVIELLFRQLNILQRMKLIEVTPSLKIEKETIPEFDPRMTYNRSVYAARKLFRYNPRFLYSHFKKFFDLSDYGNSFERERANVENLSQSQILEGVRKQVELRLSQKYNVKRVMSQAISRIAVKIETPFSIISGPKHIVSSPTNVSLDLGKDERGRDIASCLQTYVALLQKRGVKLHTLIVLGSRAKGRGQPQSDVDVTIIASNLPGKSTSEFTNFAQKIMNLRRELLLSDFPLLFGVQQSSCCSKTEFIQWLKEFRVIALDAVYYGKVIYDDGFWKEVRRTFEKIDKEYHLNRTELPKLLYLL